MAEQQNEKAGAQNTYLHYLILRFRSSVRRALTPYLKKMRRASLLRRERYIFTDKRHPEKGIFSAAMGILALFGILYAVKLTFDAGGVAMVSYALAVLLSFVIAVSGFIAGVIARKEKDVFFLFPNLGIFFNILSILLCVAIVGIGLFL